MTYDNPAALARKNLDRRLSPLRATNNLARPPRGWIRAIRDALGMTSGQLARRLRVSQPRVIQLERAETDGSVTLKTLRQAAEGLECALVYALVPTKPLDDILRRRARLIADEQLGRTHHTMRLENQALEPAALREERERLVDELLSGALKRLWDTP